MDCGIKKQNRIIASEETIALADLNHAENVSISGVKLLDAGHEALALRAAEHVRILALDPEHFRHKDLPQPRGAFNQPLLLNQLQIRDRGRHRQGRSGMG